jgi:D-alanyl-lipoteichoic acid acyltransferase DltB (MBOAT superfamily)
MLFNSLGFLVFFPIVFSLYWLFPGKFRPFLLLLASCYFYMAFVPKYILVLFFLITLDYFLAKAIENGGKKKHFYFLLSIVSNLGTLFVFKYVNFFNENITLLAHAIHWNYSLEALHLILPLGLSFHIFQSLAYIIEVYKGRYTAERKYLTYALYVLFFPQLVAGPIERPAELLPQLSSPRSFEYAKTISGLRLMLWGFFKKIVIANNLALLVTFVYGRADAADASMLLIAIVAFSFQLYADFSGYSDIAVGSARMLGIDLVQNFRQPYFSRSVGEFWRRWHISLSSWFRDYVYYPLAWKGGGNILWLYGAVIITFLLTGVWHGAGWNFVVMGLYFGLVIALEQHTQKWRTNFFTKVPIPKALHSFFQIITTFSIVSIAWVFFRAESIGQACTILRRLISQWSSNAFAFLHCTDYCAVYSLGLSKRSLALVGVSIGILLYVEYIQQSGKPLPSLWQRRSIRWSAYYALGLWILVVGYFAPLTFIYFQF